MTRRGAIMETLEIPVELHRQFGRLKRRLWWVDTVLAASGVTGALLVSYLVVFLCDRMWDTPVVGRLVCWGLGWAGAGWFGWGWVRRWVWVPRDTLALAELVQRHYRRLGDRLLGIVELADPARRPGNVSPQLCRAAIRQVSEEALRFDFRQAVATRGPTLLAVGVLGLAVLVLAPWVWVPEASWNAWARWWWPPAGPARYTFIQMESMPDHLVVAHGEPFEIAVGVSAHRFWRPKTASCQVEGQPAMQLPLRGGRVVVAVPGLTEPKTLVLKVGDVRRQLGLEPVLRPVLRGLRATIEFPAYLQHPKQEVEVVQGALDYLEGSRLQLGGQASRALQEARVRLTRAGEGSGPETILELDEDSFQSGWLNLEGCDQAVFQWKDQWGLTSSAPWVLTLTTHADEAPAVGCPQQASTVAILEDEILEIKAVADDDYGLRDLAVAWECRKRHDTNLLARQESVLVEGDPQARQLQGVFHFAPPLFQIPPDTLVTLQAVARDYHPDRAPSRSGPVQIYILSQEEHARLIQQELERVMAELEEVTRRQEALKAAGEPWPQADPETLRSEEATRGLAEQARGEEALAERMRTLAQKTTETLREALRNRAIPTRLLEDWAHMAEQMQQLASRPMPQAAQALSEASQQPARRAEALQEALELEEEILRRLLELQRQIGPALDQLLANSLAQRLRGVAKTEERIGRALQEILPETIGLAADHLNGPQRMALGTLGGDQDQARRQSQQLQDEIGRFFERTGETNHGAVVQAMKEQEAVGALADLAVLIHDNVAALAIQQTRRWDAQFREWADQLELAKLDGGGGGGSGGGGSMSEEALRRLLALLRLRQQEQGIRAFTQILEPQRESNRRYREEGIILSIRQNYLVKSARALEESGPSRYLPQARQAMEEAERFLMEPRTDETVVAVETDVVNLLEAEIREMLQSSQGSSLAAAMAMMMQMMGMGASPGGSLAGGTTDQLSPGLTGDVEGPGAEARDVEKTGGASTRALPVEYREAMQHFFRRVQQLPSRPAASP